MTAVALASRRLQASFAALRVEAIAFALIVFAMYPLCVWF